MQTQVEVGLERKPMMTPELFTAAREGDTRAWFPPSESSAQAPGGETRIDVETVSLTAPTAGGDTVLHIAASLNHLDLADEICRREVSLVKAVNNQGDTPLHCAARAGHDEMVKRIIRSAKQAAGADVKLSELLTAQNKEGDTALHEAVQYRHLEVVKALVEEDVSLTGSKRQASMVNEGGMSPLYLAVMANSRRLVEALLKDQLPAAVSHSGPKERTALHAAIVQNAEIIDKLLKWKPELCQIADDSGSLPLHYAAKAGLPLVAKTLVASDSVAAYVADNDGLLAIHIAAHVGNIDVIRQILIKCPDCGDLLDKKKKRNLLHIAVDGRQLKVVRYASKEVTLEKLWNHRDYEGNTPLHKAAANGDAEMVNALLRHKTVEPNIMNHEGLTPRDLAAKKRFSFQRMAVDVCLFFCGARLSPEGQHLPHDQDSLLEDSKPTTGESKASNQDSGEEPSKELKAIISTRSQYATLASILIATITFAAAFTLPGGYIAPDDSPAPAPAVDDHALQGTPVLAKRAAFKAFLMFDAFSMVCSVVATFLFLYAGLVTTDAPMQIRNYEYGMVLLWLSFDTMIVAFALGVYVAVAPVILVVAIVVLIMAFSAPLHAATTVIVIPFWTTFISPMITFIIRYGLYTTTGWRAVFNIREKLWKKLMKLIRSPASLLPMFISAVKEIFKFVKNAFVGVQ